MRRSLTNLLALTCLCSDMSGCRSAERKQHEALASSLTAAASQLCRTRHAEGGGCNGDCITFMLAGEGGAAVVASELFGAVPAFADRETEALLEDVRAAARDTQQGRTFAWRHGVAESQEAGQCWRQRWTSVTWRNRSHHQVAGAVRKRDEPWMKGSTCASTTIWLLDAGRCIALPDGGRCIRDGLQESLDHHTRLGPRRTRRARASHAA